MPNIHIAIRITENSGLDTEITTNDRKLCSKTPDEIVRSSHCAKTSNESHLSDSGQTRPICNK